MATCPRCYASVEEDNLMLHSRWHQQYAPVSGEPFLPQQTKTLLEEVYGDDQAREDQHTADVEILQSLAQVEAAIDMQIHKENRGV